MFHSLISSILMIESQTFHLFQYSIVIFSGIHDFVTVFTILECILPHPESRTHHHVISALSTKIWIIRAKCNLVSKGIPKIIIILRIIHLIQINTYLKCSFDRSDNDIIQLFKALLLIDLKRIEVFPFVITGYCTLDGNSLFQRINQVLCLIFIMGLDFNFQGKD